VTDEQSSRLFLDEPSNELRQGDVCFEWPIPKWLLSGYMVASEPTADRAATALVSVHAKGESLPVVVCSHDCDLENPRSRTGVVVAPLFHWPNFPMGSDVSLGIISSDLPGDDGAYEHINLYPFKLPLDPPDWRVIDFSAMTSIGSPQKSIPMLLKAKRYEMTDKARENFCNKLAAFFIRKN
jgi:hypothetical protein